MGLESLLDVVSSSPWTYAAVLGVAAFDALVPLVPSETAVIAAGVLAAAGDLQIAFVVAAGAAGAYLGDTSAYWLGRSLGGRLDRSLFRGERAARRRVWAERALDRHGGPLILGARFVPGGRTATTLTAGIVRMRWLRFAAFAAVAAIVWASYAGFAGYVGGRAFEERPLVALAAGFGVAAGVYAAVELVRFARRRARPDAAGASGGALASQSHGGDPSSAPPLDGYAAVVGGDDLEYVVRDNPAASRYEILCDGEPLGFIQYWISGDRIGLVHTELLSSAKGHGVGSRLMAGALADIRERGLSVVPLCPFVVAYLRRHPDQRGLIDRARTA